VKVKIVVALMKPILLEGRPRVTVALQWIVLLTDHLRVRKMQQPTLLYTSFRQRSIGIGSNHKVSRARMKENNRRAAGRFDYHPAFDAELRASVTAAFQRSTRFTTGSSLAAPF
jgi:hypothetical protein